MAGVLDDPERWRRISAILDRLLETPAAERPALLHRLCAGDPELRAEVEALLAADAATGGILDRDLDLDGDLDGGGGDADGDRTATLGLAAGGRRLGPYRVVRRAGGGGMGVVYEGWDDRLGRPVALKLLPPEWSRDPTTRERFLREARAASALDHPNICTVHDVGTSADGQLFIVMTFYGGETLRDRIARGPLPAAEARALAVQVARGLARAHGSGVVHRDVKPANVMVTEHGEAKIVDFGIAKVAGDAGLTRTGGSPGTPAYMAPEQLTGGPVDHRADLWAVGVLLHEMLTGRRPFPGDGHPAVIHGILHRDPEPLPHHLPGDLRRTVAKALEKDPERRHRSAAELAAELETGGPDAGGPDAGSPDAGGPEAIPTLADPGAPPRPRRRRFAAAGLAAAGVAAVMAAVWWGVGLDVDGPRAPAATAAAGGESAVEAVPVVGVVPLVNRTGDPELDPYGAVLARLVGDLLSQSRHLRVASAERMEELAAGSEGASLAHRAGEAGIDHLVSGEILPGDGGYLLAARLAETGKERRQLAARRLDAPTPADLLRRAEEIAGEVRRALAVPPTELVDVFAADYAAKNPVAYELYVEGLRAFAHYRYAAAEESFRAALERAPDFTMARYRLAHVEAVTGRTDQALATIRRAVAEADRLGDREARYLRATEAYVARRYDQALAAFAEIVDRYPYEVEARYLRGLILFGQRRYREVLEETEILARLAPANPIVHTLSGEAHLAAGNLHRAVLDLRRAVELLPGSANNHHSLGNAYRAQGELDLAAAEYLESLRLDPAFHFSTLSLAEVRVFQGRWREAEELLDGLLEGADVAPRHRIDAAFHLAAVHRARGRFAAAAELLEAMAEPIAAERIRDAMAHAVRATCQLELGRPGVADHLAGEAVARSPGVPTRYLFARGLVELHQGRLDAVAATADRILEGALPPENPDRTEEKAAAHLRGLRHLARGEVGPAIEELTLAVALEGYEYGVYRLGLARAYLAAARLDEAMAAARQAAGDRDLTAPRLDLELDRTRALLLLARIQAAMDRPGRAAELARDFLARWADADPGHPDLAAARALAAAEPAATGAGRSTPPAPG